MRPTEAGVSQREEPTQTVEAFRTRISRAMSGGVRSAYDHLGTVMAASVLWISLALVLGMGGSGLLWQAAVGRSSSSAALLSLLGGLAAAGIGTGPVTAALFAHVRRLVGHDDPRWWELARSLACFWRQGLALAALQVLVTLVLVSDALFFCALKPALLRGIGAAFLYPILFWWGASLLQWPLAAERPLDPMSQVVKKSFLLILDNLGYVSAFTAVGLLFSAFCLLGPLGWLGLAARPLGWLALIFLWAGTMAFIQTAALRELLPKYGLLAPPAPFSSPAGKTRIGEENEEREEE